MSGAELLPKAHRAAQSSCQTSFFIARFILSPVQVYILIK
jgi:hypothetical protein